MENGELQLGTNTLIRLQHERNHKAVRKHHRVKISNFIRAAYFTIFNIFSQIKAFQTSF